MGQVDEAEVTNSIVSGNEKAQEAANTAAEVDYRKALALDPKRTEAQFNLANNHYAGAHYDEAAQRYFLTQKMLPIAVPNTVRFTTWAMYTCKIRTMLRP